VARRALRRGPVCGSGDGIAVERDVLGGLRAIAATGRSASLSRADIAPPPDQTWRHVLTRNASPEEAVGMRSWFGKVDDDLMERADREAAAGAKIVF